MELRSRPAGCLPITGPPDPRRARGRRRRSRRLGGRAGDPGAPAGRVQRPRRRRAASRPRQRALPSRAVAPRRPRCRPAGRLRAVGRGARRERAAGTTRRRGRGRGRGGHPRARGRGTVAVGDVSNSSRTSTCWPRRSLRGGGLPRAAGLGPRARGGDARVAEWLRRGTRRRRCGPNVEVRLAAHAPHSVSPALFAGLVARGRAGRHAPGGVARRGAASWPTATGRGRASWTRAASGHVAFDPPGMSPVRLLRRAGRAAPRPGGRARRAGGRGRPRAAGRAGRARRALPAQQPQPRGRDAPRARSCWPPACGSASAPTAWPACASWTCSRTPSLLRRAVPGARRRGDRAHGDARRGRGAGPRRPGRDRAGPAGRAGLRAGRGRSPGDPQAFLLSGEARLARGRPP